jgi:benzoate transport
MNNNIKALINDNPMSRFQLIAVAICFLINMLDGFDVLVIAFTANNISNEWALSGKSTGMLFSSGLAGMAIGAIFLGRLADVYGRRMLIVACLTIITLGMLLSSITNALYQLVAMRVLTGIGIGGALASVNIITAEYSSNKRRGLAISVVQVGYPLGGMIGGAVAAFLVPENGWRSIFVFGAFLSAIMIPVVLWRLPESIDYLLVKRPDDVLKRINNLLGRMGHEAISALSTMESQSVKLKASVRRLWTTEYRGATTLMWLGFFMIMASMYFVLSWTPKLLMDAGSSTKQGISGGMILHLGGIIGQLAFGFLSAKFALKRLIIIYMFVAAVCMILFGMYSHESIIAMYIAVGVGFFLMGAITGFYTLCPALYPADIRATAMGWAIGIGRIGAIFSPFVAGVLLDLEWTSSSLFIVFSIPMLVGLIFVMSIRTD